MLPVGLAEAQVNPPASPFLSPDHWSYGVLRRLDDAGLLPRGADVARQSIPQEEIAAWLAVADSARGTSYALRFRREYRAARPAAFGVLESSLQLGYRWTTEPVAPGIGYDPATWQDARLLPDDDDFRYGSRLAVAYAPHLSAAADFTGDVDDWFWQVNGMAGHVGGWVGRRVLGYATGDGGGLVLDNYPLAGGGVYLTKPLRLPVLGATRFEMHLTRIDNVLNLNGVQRETEPWFWTARGSIAPHERLRLGISRGMMFGGEGNLPVTFERVARNLVGIYADPQEYGFANQVMSIDIRWRVPAIPLSAYLDWGTDDAAGALADVPGILAGLTWTHVASTFDLALGAEHLRFSGACCGNSIWYRNAWFRGAWADGDRLLGHPLGGHGREWRVYGQGSADSGRITGQAAFYLRRRYDENVLVPLRQGSSTGLRAGSDFQVRSGLRVVLDGEVEWGASDWTMSRLLIGLRNHF